MENSQLLYVLRTCFLFHPTWPGNSCETFDLETAVKHLRVFPHVITPLNPATCHNPPGLRRLIALITFLNKMGQNIGNRPFYMHTRQTHRFWLGHFSSLSKKCTQILTRTGVSFVLYYPINLYMHIFSIIHIWCSLALGQIWILETKTYIVYMGKTFRLYFFYNPCIWHSLALGQIQIIEKIWPQYFSHINTI